MRRTLFLPCLVAALATGCAKEEPPPGTGPDREPPRPVRLTPERDAVVPGFDGSAAVRFDEPLQNPRNLERQVSGSPAGRWRVDPKRSGIDVRPEGGWRDGVVYYIRLAPGVADLLRNQTKEPVEWLFSTGGPVPDTEVSGTAIDRVTTRGGQGTRVLFLSADSVPYTAVTDTGGHFRLPGLPPGAYVAAAFQDQNRNFAYDAEFEPGVTQPFTVNDERRRPELRLVMLPADSTPPVATEASAPDSLTVRLVFDDPLDPGADLSGVEVAVTDSASGRTYPVDSIAVGDVTAPRPAPPAAPDSAAAPDGSGAAPDSLGAAPDSAGAAQDSAGAAPDSAAAVDILPARGQDMQPAVPRLSLILAEPLAPGRVRVVVRGVPNLRQLVGGGDVTFTYERPPPRPAAAPRGAEVDGAPPAEQDSAGAAEAEDDADDAGADDGEGEPEPDPDEAP